MSDERVAIGIFEVDPELIPDPPKVPLGTPLVFEVAKATRVEGNKDNGDGTAHRYVYVDVQAKAVDVEGTPSVFPRLWVTEKFKGAPARSWKHFLEVIQLPYTTIPDTDLVGVRFKGVARKSKRDDEAPELASVAGPVSVD